METSESLPRGGRIAGGTLALACALLGAVRVPPLLAEDLVFAAATAVVFLVAVGAAGLAMALLPRRAARWLEAIGVPATAGGAAGFGLVLGVSVLLFGLLATVSAVAGLEYLARGRQVQDLFQPPTFRLIVANLVVNLALFFAASVGYLRLARGTSLRRALRALGFRGGPKDALEGIGWSLAALLLLGALGAVLTWTGQVPERNVLAELITQALTFPQAVTVSLLAALGEEVFFRGFLQPRVGLVPQALLFSLAHASYLNTFEIVGTLVLGLAFGWAYRRTQSLYAPIAGHAAVNTLVFALAHYAPQAQ